MAIARLMRYNYILSPPATQIAGYTYVNTPLALQVYVAALYVEAERCAHELGVRYRGGFFANDDDYTSALLDGAFNKVMLVRRAAAALPCCCAVVSNLLPFTAALLSCAEGGDGGRRHGAF